MDAGHNKTKGKKMTQDNFSFEWHNPSHGGSRNDANGIRIIITNSKKGKYRAQLSIRFYEDIMRAMRWVCGDRVSIGFDFNQQLIAIKRNNDHGYCLSACADTKKKREENIGTHSTCVVKMKAPHQFIGLIDKPLVINFDKCADVDGLLIVPFKSKTN